MAGWMKSFPMLLALLAFTSAEAADTFFTKPYPYTFLHNMGGYGTTYAWKQETLDMLSRFETIWVGNEFALPEAWANALHAAGRKILFYEFFPAVHFLMGKQFPAASEAWKTNFLDPHKTEFWSINPLKAPEYTDYAPGRHFSSLPYAYDYFINYGNPEAEDYLIHQYYDVRRADWRADGIFFDLMGSYWMGVAQIQDPNDNSKWLGALDQYRTLGSTRSNPQWNFDQNGAAFLLKLRAKNPDPSAFPLWGNQAYRSGDATSGANDYYRVIDVDLMESTFSTWYNPSGWKKGVRVMVDGQWRENACPVETLITPFFSGVNEMQPLIRQSVYAASHYGHPVSGVVLNYVRPYYQPREDGYEATTDRQAIYYGYAAGRVTGLLAYAFDYFDTVSNATGVPGAPATTGLPLQGYFKWSSDPIYFLDLGGYVDGGYETVSLGGGRAAVLRFFEKGFIIINASNPAQDITVDLSTHGRLKGNTAGVFGYQDHFAAKNLPSATKIFTVPATYYPLANIKTNSARVYSYTREDGTLWDPHTGVSAANAYQ